MSSIHILSLQNLNNKYENIAFNKYSLGGKQNKNSEQFPGKKKAGQNLPDNV